MAADAVFRAEVSVALALLRVVAVRFLAAVVLRLAAVVVFFAALVPWVLVVLALVTVVSADCTVAFVDCWRRIRPTRISPRLTRSA